MVNDFDRYIDLLRDHFDNRFSEIKEDILEIRKDVSDLKTFKWKVTGIVIAAGSGTGLTGFGLAKLLEQLFSG